MDDSEQIDLRNGVLDSNPVESLPDSPLQGFYILTHEYPVPSSWVHNLAQEGVECWSFLPKSAFHCELSGQTPKELAKLNVNGIAVMPSSAKLHPDLIPSLKGEMDSWFITKGLGIVNLVLSGDTLPDGIESRGDVEVLSHNWRWATVEVRISGVNWLVDQPEVEWIEPKFERKTLNDVADGVIDATILRMQRKWLE